MDTARHDVFQAAQDYYGAAARYFRAFRTGQNMESVTQEVLGHSIVYDLALRRCAGSDSARRLRILKVQLAAMNERYALLARHAAG